MTKSVGLDPCFRSSTGPVRRRNKGDSGVVSVQCQDQSGILWLTVFVAFPSEFILVHRSFNLFPGISLQDKFLGVELLEYRAYGLKLRSLSLSCFGEKLLPVFSPIHSA